jgi:hypothetical protein
MEVFLSRNVVDYAWDVPHLQCVRRGALPIHKPVDVSTMTRNTRFGWMTGSSDREARRLGEENKYE